MEPVVLITSRSPGAVAEVLDASGVRWVHIPLLEWQATGAPPPKGRPDHVLLSSAASLEFADLDQLRRARLHVVGAKTAEAARGVGLEPTTVARGSGSGLVAVARSLVRPGESVWYVGGEQIAGPTTRALATWDHPVEHWPVYRTVVPEEAAGRLEALGPVGVVCLASPRTAASFVELGGQAEGAVCIGPTTAAATERLGLEVMSQASEPSHEALARAALIAVALLGEEAP